MFFERQNKAERFSDPTEQALKVINLTLPVFQERFQDYCLHQGVENNCTLAEHPAVFRFCCKLVTTGIGLKADKHPKEILTEVPLVQQDEGARCYLVLALSYHVAKGSFVVPLINEADDSQSTFGCCVKIWEPAELFNSATAIILRFEVDPFDLSLPCSPNALPLLLSDAFWHAYQKAAELADLFQKTRERTDGALITVVPFGSVIVATLLNQALQQQEGFVTGITGLRVPPEEEGEYAIGLCSTVYAIPAAEPQKSLVVDSFTEEKVHRFQVFIDTHGVLTTEWLGDDGEKFGLPPGL